FVRLHVRRVPSSGPSMTSAPTTSSLWGRRDTWLAVVLVAGTLAIYFPALQGGFIWNDSDYVTQPDLRSLSGLWRIWSEVGATEQYYPLLHSWFWLQHRLWGD